MLNKELEETVLIVDSGDLNPNNADIITTNFTEWINDGCLSKTEEVSQTDSFDTCSIVLIKTPEGGLKDLVEIKSVLGNDISAADLLKSSRNIPSILENDFPYGKAKKLIEKLGSTGAVLQSLPEEIKD